MKSIVFVCSLIFLFVFALGAAVPPVFAQPDTGLYLAQETDVQEEAQIKELKAMIVQLLALIVELQEQLLVTLEQEQIATGLACGKTQVVWNQVSGAQSYVLYRNGAEVYSGKALKFVDTGLQSGGRYDYAIRARNAGGLGPSSAVQTITASWQCPPLVPIVQVQEGACGGNMQVSWSQTNGATFYEVFRGKTRISGGNASVLVDRGLKTGKSYIYKVRAGNAGGWGEFSQAVTGKASGVCFPEAPKISKTAEPFIQGVAAKEGIFTVALYSKPSGVKIRPQRSANILSLQASAKLSPMVIERVDVEFSDRAWLFLSDIEIRDGSRRVARFKATEDVFSQVDDERWRIRFSGLSIQIKEGKNKTISVRATARENANLRDSRQIDVSIPANSMRGRDEMSIAHFGPTSNSFAKTFFVGKRE